MHIAKDHHAQLKGTPDQGVMTCRGCPSFVGLSTDRGTSGRVAGALHLDDALQEVGPEIAYRARDPVLESPQNFSNPKSPLSNCNLHVIKT